jgi:hypothetical protein
LPALSTPGIIQPRCEIQATNLANIVNPNCGGLVANMTFKTQNCCDKFIIHKLKNGYILYKSLCLILYKKAVTEMMSCLIILSKCPDLCLFWGSVQMHSGWHVVGMLWGRKFKIKKMYMFTTEAIYK